MKQWFLKLKEIAQLILIMVGMAFIIALIDPDCRQSFIDMVGRSVDVVVKSAHWGG